MLYRSRHPVSRARCAAFVTISYLSNPRLKLTRSSRRIPIVAALVAVGALVWQVVAALHQPAARPQSDTPVTIGAAAQADIPLQLEALGTVTPRATVTVKTQVNGTLNAVLIKEGQQVKAGQVIARIDSRALRAQLREAQGTLEHDEALLANAQADLKRYESLIDGGSVSRQTLDTQRATMRQYVGTVKADRGSVENLRVQVGYCDIAAPMDGRIGLLSVDAGNYVTTSDTTGIATITTEAPTDVVYAVPEDKIGDVVDAFHASGTLPVEILARDKTTLLDHATLQSIDNQADTSTGTVKLKARAPNRDSRLFPNRFVNVRMTVGTLHGALTVPTVALQHGASGDFVLTLDAADAGKGAGKVKLRHVVAGVVYNGVTVIQSGELHVGDMVIVDGADKLDDGSAVKIVKS